MELQDAIDRRRMVRSFTDEAVAPAVVDRLLANARRAPSAGNTQGWSFLVLEGPEQTARFWDVSLPPERRAGFAWPGLLRAPVLVVPLAEPDAYVARYAEPDKVASGLGVGADAWPVAYWDVDTAFATMSLLLTVVDAGLGALFFGLFGRERAVLDAFGVPADRRAIGAVAIGHPAGDERPGRSAARPRRDDHEVVHRGHWGGGTG
ncbi:MAG TPA: nitroreductase family protein [Acidimicrobiales bacterium]|nr:nitroreductase family protein [Acidimicrobiales bacterium]